MHTEDYLQGYNDAGELCFHPDSANNYANYVDGWNAFCDEFPNCDRPKYVVGAFGIYKL